MSDEKTENNQLHDIKMKLLETQSIIKNKFNKAYANRLEQEDNLFQTTSTSPLHPVESSNDATSLSITKHSINITHNNPNNPNELCDKLRLLLSTMIDGDVKHREEMNAIVTRLRELNILV